MQDVISLCLDSVLYEQKSKDVL